MSLSKRLSYKTQQAKTASRNLYDRLFKTDTLVQAGKTPYQVIYEHDIVRLRYYPPLQSERITVNGQDVEVTPLKHRVPLVLVMPFAVNALIYDLFPERSLVKYLRARGFELYLIDWGSPSTRHHRFNFATYIAEFMPMMLAQVRLHSGQRQLSLHGWSLGGLLSYCYTALQADKDIVNLVLVGAPCDYHNNGKLGDSMRVMWRGVQWLDRHLHLTPHHMPTRLWHSSGFMNSMTFKLTDPIGSIKGYVKLLGQLTDRELVSKHATNSAYLDNMVAYPGGVMQDLVEYVWGGNWLAQGRVPIANCDVKIANIQSNLLLISGHQDVLVTHDCTQPILGFMADGVDKKNLQVNGGHMGLLAGNASSLAVWSETSDWLAARSC